MKKHKFLSLALLLPCAALAATPLQLKEEIAATPGKSGGIYFAYPYDSDSVPAFPKGYRPVYVSHYGRHGSRWAINEKQYGRAAEALEREHAKGNLSDTGLFVLGEIRRIGAHAAGHAGELTPLGQVQHKAIAQRMMERTPALFRDSARVTARSSVEPRCIVSMAAFSEALKERNPKLRISRSASPGDMDFISWSSPEAKEITKEEAPWRTELQHFRDSVLNPRRLACLLFKDPDKAVLPKKIWKTIHDIAVTTQNTGLDSGLLGIFNADELFALWQPINYNMYVCHANAPRSNAAGMKSARSLLLDIVSRADAALHGEEVPAVDLRFGHDTALIRLLALMRLEGCAESETDPDRYCSAWQDFRISPMGANLQLIFLQPSESSAPSARAKSSTSAKSSTPSESSAPSESRPPLVLILHNERPALLPIDAPTAPFYPWPLVKSLWRER